MAMPKPVTATPTFPRKVASAYTNTSTAPAAIVALPRVRLTWASGRPRQIRCEQALELLNQDRHGEGMARFDASSGPPLGNPPTQRRVRESD
eukprot:3660701-Pyramimonas_sp.AAC.1